MKKTSNAFSLIEVLIAIMLLSFLTLFFLPEVRSNLDDARKIKNMADTSFILQEAIEVSRRKEIGYHSEEIINGKKVEINVETYKYPGSDVAYKKIRASIEEKSFELIEACDE